MSMSALLLLHIVFNHCEKRTKKLLNIFGVPSCSYVLMSHYCIALNNNVNQIEFMN